MKVTLIANTPDPQRLIETCARISYDSKNDPFDPEVNSKFIRKLVENGHESPLEHASVTLLIEGISRACSHQIVRHRLCSFTQRSSRYTSVTDKAPGDRYVFPLGHGVYKAWQHDVFDKAIDNAEQAYLNLVASGVPKEDARFILPQAEATSLYMTANFREWRHFLKLRLDRHAQWEIREVAERVLGILSRIAPDCFHDFARDESEKAFADKCVDLLNKCEDNAHGGPLGALKVGYEKIGG